MCVCVLQLSLIHGLICYRSLVSVFSLHRFGIRKQTARLQSVHQITHTQLRIATSSPRSVHGARCSCGSLRLNAANRSAHAPPCRAVAPTDDHRLTGVTANCPPHCSDRGQRRRQDGRRSRLNGHLPTWADRAQFRHSPRGSDSDVRSTVHG